MVPVQRRSLEHTKREPWSGDLSGKVAKVAETCGATNPDSKMGTPEAMQTDPPKEVEEAKHLKLVEGWRLEAS